VYGTPVGILLAGLWTYRATLGDCRVPW